MLQVAGFGRRALCAYTSELWCGTLRGEASRFLTSCFLEVDRDGEVGHAAPCQGCAAGEMRHVFHVRRAHHALVEDANIHEELVEGNILLREGADQVVKLQAGDGENGGAIELRVIESV